MNALRDGIQRVSDEAGGMLMLQVIQRGDMPALVLDALAGSDEAAQLLRMARDMVASVQAAPRKKPMLCGACPRALRNGRFALIIAKPACDNPTQGIAMAICPRCGPTYGAIQAAAAVALRRIWPDLRPIAVTHQDGRGSGWQDGESLTTCLRWLGELTPWETRFVMDLRQKRRPFTPAQRAKIEQIADALRARGLS